MQINYSSIGSPYSPHKSIADMPIQPSGADGVTGIISLESEYLDYEQLLPLIEDALEQSAELSEALS